jgi:hypothetical protein
MMTGWSSEPRRGFLTALLCCAAGVAFVNCSRSGGAGHGGMAGSGGTADAAAGNGGQAGQGGDAGSTTSAAGTTGDGGTTGGAAGATGPAGVTDGAAGSADGAAGEAGSTGGAAGMVVLTFKNYEVTGTFPNLPVAVVQKPGQLQYTKVVIHDQFLAESCSIGDYNNDGVPDVSSGRIWYQGTNDPTTTFKTSHPFRDGHGVLPRSGAGSEINTGVSDDWADFPWDVDGDGNADIINIAQCDVPEDHDSTLPGTGGPNTANAAGTPNKIGTVQVHATAVWYQNPGPAGLAGDPKWVGHLMHSDVRLEQHGLIDMNGDGFPEILGACKSCTPPTTKGYYQADPANPTATWIFHSVTAPYTFPFGGLGYLHGLGGGDVNGDGKMDLLEKGGAWLQQPGGTWNQTPCTGKNVPAGCGWIKAGTPLLPMGFSALGLNDTVGWVGPSHMYAVDMDKDGLTDVVSADWAHGIGLYWYRQGADFQFTKYQFMGDSAKDNPSDVVKWGAGFTEPHALQVVDMDGDGRPDVVSGKMRFACTLGCADFDARGTPYIYVFKNVAATDPRTGAPITLEPHLVDGDPNGVEGTPAAGMGVAHQIAIGHVNTDGIMDICVATKVGLAVFLGK